MNKFNLGDKVYIPQGKQATVVGFQTEGRNLLGDTFTYAETLVVVEFETTKTKHGETITENNTLAFPACALTKNNNTEKKTVKHRAEWQDTIVGLKHPLSFNLHHLYMKSLEGGMDLNPEYQRDFVWTEIQQQEYIQAL